LSAILYIKHEIITCERCGLTVECRANASIKCQCSAVNLSIEEMQYINERYDACLCAACLNELKSEYYQEYILKE